MLEFELKAQPPSVLEVYEVNPNLIRCHSLKDVQQTRIFVGNAPCCLGDWFNVSGDGADLHHVWSGDLSSVSGIGYRMSDGLIEVRGSIGNHLGSRMIGGEIRLTESAGDYVGAEMSGGLIRIQGDAGDFLGANYDGGKIGQHGGMILVDGSAGDDVGRAMRRGLIAIRGRVAKRCGFIMRAGTILVCDEAGLGLGHEMVRGTIMLGKAPRYLSERFRFGSTQRIAATQLILKHIEELGFADHEMGEGWSLYHGDRLRGGRGELLISTSL